MSAGLTTGVALAEYARSILRQVESFDQDEFWERTTTEDRVLFGVEPILLALSMELALKAWFVFDHDTKKAKRSHDLLKLFKALKAESQKRLDMEFRKSVALTHPNALFLDYGIENILHQHANAFVEWRYPYERTKSMMFETGAFKATLELVLREFGKRYRVVNLPHQWF